MKNIKIIKIRWYVIILITFRKRSECKDRSRALSTKYLCFSMKITSSKFIRTITTHKVFTFPKRANSMLITLLIFLYLNMVAIKVTSFFLCDRATSCRSEQL